MDKPLLDGESSGGRRRGQTPVFHRRSDAIAYGSPYQKAAALVDLAEDGIGLPEQMLDQESFESAAKFYFIFIRFNFLWSLNLFALIVLNFLEKPLWCAKQTTYSCNDREYYFLGQLPYLTSVESLIYEGITLVIILSHTFFPISYEGSQIYWKNPLNRLKVILLSILVADLLVYVLYLSPLPFYYLPFRLAPYIRVILCILNIREVRATMVILAGMLGTYLNIMALGLLFLLFASWVAYVMFEDTQQGKTVFTSYLTTLYQMFILFTTSNNPDVWIPAYKVSRWYCLFFVLYMLLGVYFMTNLILAVIYDSFKNQLAKQVAEMDRMRRRILEKAFNLIDKSNLGFLKKEQCIHLFEELNKYRSLPKISREDFELIFDELDDSNDFKINLDEFFDLCNAITLSFQKEDSQSWFERYPSFYHSPACEKLKAFVRSSIFGNMIAVILVLNLVAVIIETTLDIENNSAQKVWQKVEFVLGWIYVLEMALKVFAFGFKNYWRDDSNRFDFFITWIIVIGETATFVAPSSLSFLSNGEWIRYLLLARMLRLIRLLMRVKQYRAFIATFLNLIPSLMPYLGTIFCVLCIYCSLGVQSYKDLTGTSWTLVYFISYYLLTVLLLLNLVVAFVLEAFFAEMDLEKSENCGEDGKEVGEKQRRYTRSRIRSQRVDILLHHMLSAELNQTES
ncbi:two pore channel 1 [Vitis vinifera]|uniref:Two pore channel 1 n=1 Tax=Vitis vinifera TaxID=29760 RepID=B5LZ65_VITVI|nr:two pore channel 1 [Vitis vinifera]ACH53197.1 two pore channel 1 [Vitis vinifera]|eukprot:NP_001268025.1 two pore channel 1 [Vitis vinifera]